MFCLNNFGFDLFVCMANAVIFFPKIYGIIFCMIFFYELLNIVIMMMFTIMNKLILGYFFQN